MSGIMLTAKKFQLAIKNGLDPDGMAEKYDCTIEELKAQLKQIYKAGNGTKAQSIYGQLEANRKKASRRHPVKAKKPFEPEKLPEAPNKELKEPEKTLSDLRQDEAALSSEIIKLETEHKALSSKHRSCNDRLRELQKQIAAIKKDLLDCKVQFDTIATDADKIASQMNDITKLRRQKVAGLDEIRLKIEEMSSVEIYVYNDGKIEANRSDFIMDDTGFEQLKSDISEREECMDLRVRDVTTLARLIKICEKAEHLTLVCDNEDLEKAFWAICKSNS